MAQFKKLARLRFWGGIAVSLLLMVLTLRGVSLALAWKAARELNPWVAMATVGLILIAVLLSALRWQRIIRLGGAVRFWPLVSLTFAGYFGNNVLPARAGDLARVYFLQRDSGLPAAFCLATMVVERLADAGLLLIIALGTCPSLLWEKLASRAGRLSLVAVVGFSVLVCGCFLLGGGRRRLAPLWRSIDQAKRLLAGNARRSGRILAEVTLLTVVIWAVCIATLWLNLKAAGLQQSVGVAMTVTAVANLGLIVPSAPGGVGTYEFLMVYSLGLFGIEKEGALMFSVYFHALWLVPTSLGGALCYGIRKPRQDAKTVCGSVCETGN